MEMMTRCGKNDMEHKKANGNGKMKDVKENKYGVKSW